MSSLGTLRWAAILGVATVMACDADEQLPGPDAGMIAPDAATTPDSGAGGPADTGGEADAGTGGDMDAAGEADTGGGPADTGGGPADTGAGPPDTGAGPPDTGAGPPDTGGGPADTGAGPPDTGAGPPDSGVAADTGVSPDAGGGGPTFAQVHPILTMRCQVCHSASGIASGTGFILSGNIATDETEALQFVTPNDPPSSPLLTKGSGTVPHGGGAALPPGSPEFNIVEAWVASRPATP